MQTRKMNFSSIRYTMPYLYQAETRGVNKEIIALPSCAREKWCVVRHVDRPCRGDGPSGVCSAITGSFRVTQVPVLPDSISRDAPISFAR